ncbi:MAG: C-GCAxxG-C-C family protein [Candidatus Aminicenantes bacterium]|jgi:C_GCAxxG_C_C family probable redox protein
MSKHISLSELNHRGKANCKGICTRRFFISKSALGSMGFLLIPGMVVSKSLFDTSPRNKEEIYKQLDELVDKYYTLYGTCSQSSFHALNEVFDLKAENIIKGLVSFPGIALRGETCGAVTGSLLAIGMVYEDDQIDEDRKRLSRAPSFKFCSEFESEYGTTRCRDVIEKVTGKKYTVKNHKDYESMYEEGVFSLCPVVIKKAVRIAANIILDK